MEDPKSVFEKPTELKVGDTTYRLAFNHKALSIAEQATKLNLLRWLNTLEMSVSDLSGMLYACLLKYNPVTYDQVFEIIDRVGVGPCFEAVVSAWKQAQPDPNGQTAAG